MKTHRADSTRARHRRAARLLTAALLCAAPVFAQSDAHRALRERVDARYDVLITNDLVSLRPRGDDASALDELVSVAVVPVRVGVDDCRDPLGRRGRAPHRRKHRARPLQIEQRVDEQGGRAGIDDEARVREPPRPVRLQVREDAIADLHEAGFRALSCHHDPR